MNKIDELKRDIEFHKRGMEISKSLLANAEKDLAALEAQAGPREWTMYLTDTGQLSVSAAYLGGPFGKMKQFQPITVIEKLPVKVTMDLAKRFNREITQYIGGYKYSQEEIAEVARFFGLQAEPSND